MASILIVEDDDRVANVVALHLSKSGHSPVKACDGNETFRALDSFPIEAVILDIRLPDMSGVDILERIRQIDLTLPVIILTGQVDVDLAVDVMKKGAFDFLTKPVRRVLLLAVVDRALALKRLLEDNSRLLRENGNYQQNLEQMVETRTRELQESQQRIFQLKGQFARLDRLSAAGRMASAMAHEVKNPVVGIMSCAERMLMLEELNEGTTEAFQMILGQCARLSEVLGEFLKVTRHPAPLFKETDITMALREVVQLTQPYCSFNRVSLQASLSENLRIVADSSQLQQVALNLILNACQAMPAGGTAQISLSPDGDGVSLRVEDSGVGIPPENLSEIFQDFFSTKGDDQGTGLGLAVVKEIVERHGGRIDVDSTVDVGTTLRVWLPRQTPSLS